jgi:GTP cyclohydrolase II
MRLSAILPQKSSVRDRNDPGRAVFCERDHRTGKSGNDDERDFGIAARMLGMLNCTRIVLFTSNPAKLDGLASAGIEIAGWMPLEAPINADNRRYMIAETVRS